MIGDFIPSQPETPHRMGDMIDMILMIAKSGCIYFFKSNPMMTLPLAQSRLTSYRRQAGTLATLCRQDRRKRQRVGILLSAFLYQYLSQFPRPLAPVLHLLTPLVKCFRCGGRCLPQSVKFPEVYLPFIIA